MTAVLVKAGAGDWIEGTTIVELLLVACCRTQEEQRVCKATGWQTVLYIHKIHGCGGRVALSDSRALWTFRLLAYSSRYLQATHTIQWYIVTVCVRAGVGGTPGPRVGTATVQTVECPARCGLNTEAATAAIPVQLQQPQQLVGFGVQQ